jgi:hypothetical protein
MQLIAKNTNVVLVLLTDGETGAAVKDSTDLTATLVTIAGAVADANLSSLPIVYVASSDGKYKGLSGILNTVTAGNYILRVQGTSSGRTLYREFPCTVIKG